MDDDEFFEVHEHWARNIVIGFSRLNGRPIGVVGNQPSQLAGVLDIEGAGQHHPPPRHRKLPTPEARREKLISD